MAAIVPSKSFILLCNEDCPTKTIRAEVENWCLNGDPVHTNTYSLEVGDIFEVHFPDPTRKRRGLLGRIRDALKVLFGNELLWSDHQ